MMAVGRLSSPHWYLQYGFFRETHQRAVDVAEGVIRHSGGTQCSKEKDACYDRGVNGIVHDIVHDSVNDIVNDIINDVVNDIVHGNVHDIVHAIVHDDIIYALGYNSTQPAVYRVASE